IDTLLATSQVVLSVVLPLISFPLVYLTSKKSIMYVKIPASSANPRARSGTTNHDDLGGLIVATLPVCVGNKWFGDHEGKDRKEQELESQPCWIIVTNWLFGIWLVIVTLGSGLVEKMLAGKENITYCVKATLEDQPLLDYLYYVYVSPVSTIKCSGSTSIVNAHYLPSARVVPVMLPSSANTKNETRLHISQEIFRKKKGKEVHKHDPNTHLRCTIPVTGPHGITQI
ncbi:hypothetical protein K435DRAFT_935528, partial [Dendrothele bispora CBS 962.96]